MFLIFSVLLCYFGLGHAFAGERYSLEAQQHDEGRRTSTAVYYDSQKQRLVSKTFSWSKEFERRRAASGKARFDFPKSSRSLSNVSPSNLDEHNVKASYTVHSLSDPANRSKTANGLGVRFGSKEAARDFVARLERRVDNSSNNFELISTGKSGSGRNTKHLGVYFNKERGEFVTKVFKAKKSNSPAFNFPRKIARPDLLNPSSRDNNFSISEDSSHWAKTPVQFQSSMGKIKAEMRKAGFGFNNDHFNRAYQSMLKQREGDVLVKERYSGNNLYRVSFNFDRQELISQKLELDKNDRSKVLRTVDTVYDLTTEHGYQAARNDLVSSRIYTESALDHFRGSKALPCRDVVETHILPDLGGFENITDSLWDQQLHKAVAKNIIPSSNRSLFLELNILDKPRRVKVFLDAKGQVARMEWVGMSDEEALKEGLKLDFKTDDEGQRNYLISTNYPDKKEWKAVMGINADNIRVEKGILKGNLAVFVKGKKSGEFEYEGFEKNIFPFSFDKDRREIASSGTRIRLDGSAKNYYDIDAPFVEGSGGLKNGFFKLFFGKEGRREFVRDTIYENANETFAGPEFNHLITNREIWAISNDISIELGKKTDNYRSGVTDITAKGAQLAYAAFGDEILLRVIKEMLPEESEKAIKTIVLNVTDAFKECLARAGKSRNKEVADKCMEIFKVEAPIFVGSEILLLKLRQNDLGKMEDEANKVYMACIKENYRPVASEADSTNKIKGCLYQAFLSTVDKALGPVLDTEVKAIADSKGYKFTLTSNEKEKVLKDGRSCFNSTGLQSEGLFGTKYNTEKLNSMEPVDFENSLMGCVSEIKVDTGRVVIDKILTIELAKQDLTPEMRVETSTMVLEKGYEACINKQREVIARIKGSKSSDDEKYESGRPRPRPEKIVSVPSLEPGECANLVLNRTLSRVVPEMVKQAIGADFYNSLSEKPETKPRFLYCFDREEKRITDEIENILPKEVGLSKDEKAIRATYRAEYADRAHAGCLKEALSWASYHAVGKIVEDTLAADPELGKLVKLNESHKKLMGEKIQACFNRELKGYETVNEMTEALDPLKEKCGVELLLDDEIQGIIFKPIVEGSLIDAKVKDKNIKTWGKVVLDGMDKDMQGSKSIDELVARAKAYKGKAALQIIDFSLEEQVIDLVSLDDPVRKNKEVSRIVARAQAELLGPSGLDYRNRILEASKDENAQVMAETLDEFKLDATRLIGPEIVGLTAEGLIKDGLLDTEQDVIDMKERAIGILNKCLDNRAPGVTVDKHLDECVVKLKSDSTVWVIGKTLTKNLNQDENSRIFNGVDQERIIGRVLNDEVKKEIENISRIKDKAEADKALKRLTITIKATAGAEIVKGVIPYTLDQTVKISGGASDQMRAQTISFKANLQEELIGDFGKCLNKYKKDAEAALDGNWSNEKYDPEEEFDACSNKLRLDAMEKIIPFKFKEILRLLSKNEKQNSAVIKDSLLYFNKCTREVDIYSKTQEYKYKMDACAAMTIFGFTKGAIKYARDLGDGLFVQDEKTIVEWDACIQEVRADVSEKLSPFTSTKSLDGKKGDFEYISEAFRLNSSIKDDSYQPVDTDWIANKIKNCGLESLAPNLIQEYKMKLITEPKFKLNAKEQAVTSAFLDSLSSILTTKYDGKPTNFNVDTFIKDVNQEIDRKPEVKSESANEKDYITIMEEFQPMIATYIKDLVSYDQQGFLEGIKDFEEKVKRAIKLNKGNMSVQELKDLLVSSNLGDILLKSLVSKIIKDKSTQALKDQGVDPSGVVWQLSSKDMLNRIFAGKKGNQAITDIKRKLKGLELSEIFELLDTKNPSSKAKLDGLMKDINGKVIDTLAADTANGGFVETLFGPIAQKSLTDRRDSMESGWAALAIPFYGLAGYNRNEFHWGTRWDNRSYSLRNTPSGKKAVKYFATDILTPLMKGELGEGKAQQKEIEKRTEDDLKPLMKKALGENGVGLWE
ncbi:MAG: hypothetical protein ACJAT2_002685 [Bacteriovoracaceae bacterium]